MTGYDEKSSPPVAATSLLETNLGGYFRHTYNYPLGLFGKTHDYYLSLTTPQVCKDCVNCDAAGIFHYGPITP